MPDAVRTTTARRTFVPTVLLGLAGAIAVAIGGHRTMLTIPASYLDTLKSISPSASLQGEQGVQFPLAGALALVTLAGWGVLLVTRRTFRRVVAVLTTLAAAGVLATLVVGGFAQRGSAASDLSDRLGVTDTVPLGATGWFWVCLVGSVLTLLAAVAALRLVPTWPEMGSKYDAPTGGSDEAQPVGTPLEEQSNLDLWKSLDEGHDPTA